ncbi:MAG: hypothetical protein P8X95_13670 [Anaerolineales bacterium]
MTRIVHWTGVRKRRVHRQGAEPTPQGHEIRRPAWEKGDRTQ